MDFLHDSKNKTELFTFLTDQISKFTFPPSKIVYVRSIHQAGVWTTSTSTQQAVPSPEEFSWTKTSGTWMPLWMSMPEVSKVCHELIRCCCKGNCTNCTCAKAGIACSPLCNCKCN